MAEMRTYEVFVCPECGEQITDEPQYDEARNEYVRGHYHEPPNEIWEGEDPWLDALPLPVVDLRDLETAQAELDSLRGGVEAEIERLRAYSSRLDGKRLALDPLDFGPDRIRLAALASEAQETADRLSALLPNGEERRS